MIAKYIRLSDPDEDLGDGAKAESNSVVNQRGLLNRYLAESAEFAGLNVLEFLDDGRSGTNFDRPGVRALLDAAKRGEVNCVIVKDFSRFGRTYLEVGSYLEQVFPFLGVRFISVNDGYDSKNQPYGTAGDLDTGLRNIINEFYSRDLSEKSKMAKRQYAKRGQYISAYSFFGYVKSKEDRRRLVPDPPAAAVVRRVYELCIGGASASEIARILNAEAAPTPTARKRELGAKRKSWNSEREKNEWTGAAVLALLHEERYTGKLIGCRKSRQELGKASSSKTLPREDWIVVPDAFEAIVSQQEYDIVQERLRRPRQSTVTTNTERHLFHRKLKCGVCGLAPERVNTTQPYYKCRMQAWNAADGCGDVHMDEGDIIRAVLASIRHQAQLAVKEEKRLATRAVSPDTQRVRKQNAKLERLVNQKKTAFLRFNTGVISQAQYQSELASLNEKIAACRAEISGSNQSCGTPDRVRMSILKPYTNLRTLDAETVDKLIRRIRIYGGGRIEIVWNFAEPYAGAAIGVEDGQNVVGAFDMRE